MDFVGDAVVADVADVAVVAVAVAVVDHDSERETDDVQAAVVTDDCKGLLQHSQLLLLTLHVPMKLL